jgi:hypothetical protein
MLQSNKAVEKQRQWLYILSSHGILLDYVVVISLVNNTIFQVARAVHNVGVRDRTFKSFTPASTRTIQKSFYKTNMYVSVH